MQASGLLWWVGMLASRWFVFAVLVTAAAIVFGSGLRRSDFDIVNPFAFSQATPSVEFSESVVQSGLGYAYGVAVADFDGDGRPDIAVTDSWIGDRAARGARLIVNWGGRQPETVADRQTFPTSRSRDQGKYLLERIIPLDVNGDGRLDIVGVVNSHGMVVAYLNPGVRGRQWPMQVLSRDVPGAVNLVAADVDGDGDRDLFVSTRRQSSPDLAPRGGVVWLENRPGAAVWPLHLINQGGFVGVRTLIAHDVDHDGRPDVIVSGNQSGQFGWFRNGDWSWHQDVGVNVGAAHYSHLIGTTRSGSALIALARTGGVSVLEQDGDRWSERPVADFLNLPLFRGVTSEVAAGDFDGDGLMDLAFTRYSAILGVHGGVYWARNVGNGRWDVHLLKGDWGKAAGLVVADVNRDGRPDIIAVGEYGAQEVRLWTNLGGRFDRSSAASLAAGKPEGRWGSTAVQ